MPSGSTVPVRVGPSGPPRTTADFAVPSAARTTRSSYPSWFTSAAGPVGTLPGAGIGAPALFGVPLRVNGPRR